jgi:hypothetical protein
LGGCFVFDRSSPTRFDIQPSSHYLPSPPELIRLAEENTKKHYGCDYSRREDLRSAGLSSREIRALLRKHKLTEYIEWVPYLTSVSITLEQSQSESEQNLSLNHCEPLDSLSAIVGAR